MSQYESNMMTFNVFRWTIRDDHFSLIRLWPIVGSTTYDTLKKERREKKKERKRREKKRKWKRKEPREDRGHYRYLLSLTHTL